MTVICMDPRSTPLEHLERLTRRILPEATVFRCRRPEQALQLARSAGCDILLSEVDTGDIQLDGFMLAQKIQRRNPRVNIIFVTKFADAWNAYRAFSIFASGFTEKPLTLEKLKECFDHLRYRDIS